MKSNSRTTVRLPKGVRQEMLKRIIQEGYGLRGKSKWIAEAIDSLLVLPNFVDYVLIADQMSFLTEPEVIQLPDNLRYRLDVASIDVRKENPLLEGVQSCIIRSSIMQRILRYKQN
ncbi:MAG: hypothetical protein HRT87_01490 [Legionellales bacterium]|nr:hypothetical protein [Legionellales bacterium]